MPAPETLRVHIPLEIRRRGGRPRILPPKHVEAAMSRGQDPHLLRAIGRAWGWRQRLERGDVTTLADLAADEGLSDRYVSRLLRLAWLAPEVLERLVVHREPSTISIYTCALSRPCRGTSSRSGCSTEVLRYWRQSVVV